MPDKYASRNSSTAIVVEGIPPTVNHYKIPIAGMVRANGRVRPAVIGFRVTEEAKLYCNLLAMECQRVSPVVAKQFEVAITVVLGKGQKGDWDNFPKCVMDTLAKCGLFEHPSGKKLSDAHVARGTVLKVRSNRSRTFIEIRPYGGES